MQCRVIFGGHSASLSSCLHYPGGEAHPGWQGCEDQTPSLATVCTRVCVCVAAEFHLHVRHKPPRVALADHLPFTLHP